MNITKFMDSWILQKGYPVLNVQFNELRTSANLTQWDYAKVKGNTTANNRWNIPVNYAWSKHNDQFTNTSMSELFLAEADELIINFPTAVDWIVFNVKQTGNYP